MLKKIKNINGIKDLSNKEKKSIIGGFFGGCSPAICRDNNDCDCGPCKFFTQTINGQEVLLGGICTG